MWNRIVPFVVNELMARPKYFGGYGFIEHSEIGPARHRCCLTLKCQRGNDDAVLMMDSDQTAAVGDRPATETFTPSVVDHIVRQYLEGEPNRILFGVTPTERRDMHLKNFRKGPAGIEEAGAGLIFVPSVVYASILEAYPRPWEYGPDLRNDWAGEDIKFTSRAVKLGVELEPIRGITVWHALQWGRPLEHFER